MRDNWQAFCDAIDAHQRELRKVEKKIAAMREQAKRDIAEILAAQASRRKE